MKRLARIIKMSDTCAEIPMPGVERPLKGIEESVVGKEGSVK